MKIFFMELFITIYIFFNYYIHFIQKFNYKKTTVARKIASLRTFYNWQLNYPNFECHLDLNCFGDNGFHSKGYVFEYADEVEFVVGSTNITRFALLKNIEWNVSLCYKNEFESLLRIFEHISCIIS